METKITRLFRTGGSVGIRIPKRWAPTTERVILRKEGRDIIISEDRDDLHKLARKFAKDGLIDFERPPRPETPKAKTLE